MSALRDFWNNVVIPGLAGTATGAGSPSVSAAPIAGVTLPTNSAAPPKKGGTTVDSDSRPLGDMTPKEIEEENRRLAGYKSPKVKPSPGDGEEVSVQKAFDELRKMDGVVMESGSHDFHKKIWQEYIGNQGEPPLAFKYAGRIRVDIEKLNSEQRKIWIELDRAQAIKIKGEPAKGGGKKGGGQGGDDIAHAKTETDVGVAKTDPAQPKKGGGTDVGTAKTQPGSPPPHAADKAKVKLSPGDGQEVPIKQAFQELGKMDGVVIESGSHEFHKKIWQEYLGNKGEPPLAFKYAGRIRVDIEKLTAEQRKQWIALDQAQAAKIKGNTGDAKGGGKSNAAGQKVHDDIADYSARVNKYNDQLADFNKRKDQFDAALEKQGDAADIDKAAKLDKEAAQLDKESKALLAEGEGLSKDLQAAGAKELEAAFKTSDPKGLLEAAHKGSVPKGSPEVELIGGAAVMLANAYFIAQSISYILDADSALDAVARIGQVGVNVVVGAEEAAIFELVTDSTPVTMVLGMVVGMCGDQGGACEEQERQEREKAQKKAEKTAAYMAIGAYLEKKFPGSVTFVEDTYQINNKPLWDATVKKVAELKKLKEIEQRKKDQEDMQKVRRISPEDVQTRNQPHMDPA